MKKTVALIIVLSLLAITTAGCGQSKAPAGNESGDKISVVATIFAPYDFVREIAGDRADITMLLPPAAESHSFEPTPQDIITIQNCDAFIYVGGESDSWVSGILESVNTDSIKIITLMDCVEAVEEEMVEGMQEAEDEHGGEEAEYDEHVWTSPKNTKLIVSKLSDALCEVDAENAGFYQQNAKDYLTKLDGLDSEFQQVVDGAARKTIVFGDRFPFRYFADAYGLSYFAAFPGCSTETEPSPATVKFLIDKINDEGIPAVFHIELSNEKMAYAISEATGAKVLLLHSCHNISKDDFTSGVSYLELMSRNVDALREALK